MATARGILERGDGVMIFPEGTRVRPGPLGHPRRGVGRLALETGATVVPVAIIGSEDVRRGWRIRPRKVRVRCGAPMRFPKVERPSPALAKAVTDRIWPMRRAAVGVARRPAAAAPRRVIGAGSWGTGLAIMLARAGAEVRARLPHRGAGADARSPTARTIATCPAHRLPDAVRIARAGALELREADLVCLAVPTRDLPVAMGEIGDRLGARHEPARLLEGPRPADRRAAHRVLRRARRRPRRRLPRRPGARRRRARARRLARPGLRRRRAARAAAPPLRRRGLRRRAHHRRRRRRARRRRQERRGARRHHRLGRRAERRRRRRRQGLLRDRRLRRRRSARGPRPGPASPAPATSSPRSSRPAVATAAPASCSPAACPSARSAPRSARSPRRSTRSRCSPPRSSTGRIRAPATRALAAVVTGEGSATAFADEVTKPRRIVGARVV